MQIDRIHSSCLWSPHMKIRTKIYLIVGVMGLVSILIGSMALGVVYQYDHKAV